MHNTYYAEKSLELHLFYGRLMKEHALFLKAGFTPANVCLSDKAEFYKNEFEKFLGKAVSVSNGVISRQVLGSKELVTEFTALAEKQTETLTGIAIDKELTGRTMRLKCSVGKGCGIEVTSRVRQLNQTALRLLDGLIDFKEEVLSKVLCGEAFTSVFPLLIEHTVREARQYKEYLSILERDGNLSVQSTKETECFWDRIMMEHAKFIRGLLDPCESELIASAAAGTYGIQQKKIRSVILPLLADHILRESNHFIRLMRY